MIIASQENGRNTEGKKKFDLGVLKMRAQPLHNAHVDNIVGALEKCERLALLLGSSNKARSYKNSFTYEERKSMVEAVFPAEVAGGRIIIRPMPDFHQDNAGWAANVQNNIVAKIAAAIGAELGKPPEEVTIALAGFRKDDSTFYLDMFPSWSDITLKEQTSFINATDIREGYFRDESVILEDALPGPVVDFLERFRSTEAFRVVLDERKEIDHCREKYRTHERTTYTGDIMIMHRQDVLMIRRGGRYGHDLIAFPGGIRDEGEDFLECSLRELDEETGLTTLNEGVTVDFLKSCVRTQIDNGAKGRDLRGDYVTRLYVLVLPGDMPRPAVRADDDAKIAKFMNPSDFPETEYFADHYGMLQEALRKVA